MKVKIQSRAARDIEKDVRICFEDIAVDVFLYDDYLNKAEDQGRVNVRILPESEYRGDSEKS